LKNFFNHHKNKQNTLKILFASVKKSQVKNYFLGKFSVPIKEYWCGQERENWRETEPNKMRNKSKGLARADSYFQTPLHNLFLEKTLLSR